MVKRFNSDKEDPGLNTMKPLILVLMWLLILGCNSPKRPASPLQRTIDRIERGDYGGAIVDLDNAIQAEPRNPEFYFWRGTAKRHQKRFQEAINDLSKAVELAPNFTAALHDRAHTKLAAKDLHGALTDFDIAIKKVPNFALAYANRALTKIQLKDYDGALVDSEQAIKLSPTFAGGYNSRAMVRFVRNDFQGAWRDVDMILSLEIRPSVRADAFYDRAMFGLKLKHSETEYCGDAKVAFSLGYAIEDNGYSAADNEILKKCLK